MNLRDTTRDIINQVEETTGFPVEVVDNPALAGTAVVRIARPGMPAHVIEYKPIQGQAPDYLICYQCGFILRLFQCPPNQRVQIGSAPTGRDVAYEIAFLGRQGLDLNDPRTEYTLRTLPGQYTAMQLVSIMYAAFQQVAPEQDVGIDLSREYQAAVAMKG